MTVRDMKKVLATLPDDAMVVLQEGNLGYCPIITAVGHTPLPEYVAEYGGVDCVVLEV